MMKLISCIIFVFLSNSPSCDTVFKYVSSTDTVFLYSEDIIKIDSIGACQFHFYLSEISKLKIQSTENETGTGELYYNTGVGGWVAVSLLNFYEQEIPLGYSVVLSKTGSYIDRKGRFIDEDGCIRMNIRIPPWGNMNQLKGNHRKKMCNMEKTEHTHPLGAIKSPH